jgi:hypothetical protein
LSQFFDIFSGSDLRAIDMVRLCVWKYDGVRIR